MDRRDATGWNLEVLSDVLADALAERARVALWPFIVAVLFAVVVLAPGGAIAAPDGDDEPEDEAKADGPARRQPLSRTVVLPAIQNQPLAKARAVLGRVGFRVGNVYRMSRERVYAYYIKHYPKDKRALAISVGMEIDEVFIQSPNPGRKLPRGSAVDLIVMAEEDGRLPRDPRFRNLNIRPIPNVGSKTGGDGTSDAEGADVPEFSPPPPAVPLDGEALPPDALPAPAIAPDDPVTPARAPNGPVAPAHAPDGPVAPAHAPDGPVAPAHAPDGDPLAPSVDPDRNPWADDFNADATGDGAADEIGSPDAPRVAKAAPGRVPELIGLGLNDAEQLVRDADMILYVERVAGHPIGRVLRQAPEPGAAPGAGGVVKVVVTAGGDFDAETPEAPLVYVRDVDVPDLLDRTYLQAERILEDLGLEPQIVKSRTGLPGRVVDQQPPSGKRVPKGGLVRIWIGPGELPKAGPHMGRNIPRNGIPRNGIPRNGVPRNGVPRDAVPRDEPAPAPRAADTSSAAATDAPRPIAPGIGTRLPSDAVIPVGFSWRAVKGASAYLIEVEEAGAEGTWLPSARKPTRTTAAMLELERMDTAAVQAFRWRVRAIISGKQGTPCKWIMLK